MEKALTSGTIVPGASVCALKILQVKGSRVACSCLPQISGTGWHVRKLSNASAQNDKEMYKKNNNFRGFSAFALSY